MNQSFQFRITDEVAGQRLDEFLWSRLSAVSRMRINNLIALGACLVNAAPARAGYHIAADDLVEIALDLATPTAMTPEPIRLEIVYEDEDLIVVVKPAGMLVHPTKHVKSGTLANALAYHLNRFWISDFGFWINSHSSNPKSRRAKAHTSAMKIQNPKSVVRPGIVHRLDRATSGLMVVAKTQRALSVLTRHFHKRMVEKRYLALVDGVMDEDAGTISAPIGRDPERQPHWRVMECGRRAETRFRVQERMDGVTLVELEPVTGRTNQLRIHCAHLGHPILGDELYCDSGLKASDTFLESKIQNLKSKIGLRLCLHAWRLSFNHPASGERVEFTSPLPDDMRSLLSA